jgi:hypothetical protein
MTAIIMQAKTDKEQLTNEARAEGMLACTMPCKEKEDERQIEIPQLCNDITQIREYSYIGSGIKFPSLRKIMVILSSVLISCCHRLLGLMSFSL